MRLGWDGSNDWEFESAAADTPDQLFHALWDGVRVHRSRVRFDAAVRGGGLDGLAHASWPDGQHASIRRLVCDLIEEYGRHTGHADLLRESVDGRTGEDPLYRMAPRPPARYRCGTDRIAVPARPLLLVDVDGVLNPFAAPGCPDGYAEYNFFAGEEPVRVCPEHGRWLQELAARFELTWATAWGTEANRLLAPLLRLPELPVIEFPAAPFEPRDKLPAVRSFAGDRPLAWLDDAPGKPWRWPRVFLGGGARRSHLAD